MSLSDVPREAWAQLDGYPLAQPPDDVIPNLVDPEWHGMPVLATVAVFLPLMTIMAIIRVYSKWYITRKWLMDDWVFLISYAAGVGLMTLHLLMMTSGVYGYHAWEVKIGDLTKSALVRSLALQIGSPFLIWMIKLAVYSLIHTAFNPLRYVRWTVYAGVGLSFCYYLAAAIVSGVICGPKGGTDRLSYLAGMAGEKCGDPGGIIQILSIVSGVVNLLNDLLLLLLPLPPVFKLHLPLKQKLGVLLIFLAGSVACVMSIMGLVYRRRGYSSDGNTMWSRDTTYLQVPLLAVCTAEYGVGVIIPCMAPFARFSKHLSLGVRSYLSTRSFHRTTSSEGSYRMGGMGSTDLSSKGTVQTHTSTMDKMLSHVHSNQSETQMSLTKAEQQC